MHEPSEYEAAAAFPALILLREFFYQAGVYGLMRGVLKLVRQSTRHLAMRSSANHEAKCLIFIN
jgi:hypothetical protein